MSATGRWTALTEQDVREFLLQRYARTLKGMGINPAELPDGFDFLTSAVIDSFGVMEMITAVEDTFAVQVDLATLDAEHVTVLGPLSRHIAATSSREK